MALVGPENPFTGVPFQTPPGLGLPKLTTTASETSTSTFTVSLTTSSTGSSTASTAISSTVITFVSSTSDSIISSNSNSVMSSTGNSNSVVSSTGNSNSVVSSTGNSNSVVSSTGNSNTSPTETSFLSNQSTAPSSTLNINLSVNVSVTATLSVSTASTHQSSSNRNLPSSPAGAIAANSNNVPLTAIAGIAVGVSAFILLAVFILFLLWFYRRRRRGEANSSVRDSWANSSVQPEVVRDADPPMPRTPVPQTPTVPNMGLYSPLPPPSNPFLSNDEREALVGFAPSIPQPQQRAPSRRSFHGETGGLAGGEIVPGENGFARDRGENFARPRSAPGSVTWSSAPNRNMWRASSDLTPPIEVPEPPYDDATTALPQMPQRDVPTGPMNPLRQNPPTQPGSPMAPNIRISGRRSGSRGSNTRLSSGDQDLPESLGRLNRWLEDNRRRSRI